MDNKELILEMAKIADMLDEANMYKEASEVDALLKEADAGDVGKWIGQYANPVSWAGGAARGLVNGVEALGKGTADFVGGLGRGTYEGVTGKKWNPEGDKAPNSNNPRVQAIENGQKTVATRDKATAQQMAQVAKADADRVEKMNSADPKYKEILAKHKIQGVNNPHALANILRAKSNQYMARIKQIDTQVAQLQGRQAAPQVASKPAVPGQAVPQAQPAKPAVPGQAQPQAKAASYKGDNQMNKQDMLESMVAIANELDERGLVKEASNIDEMINKVAGIWDAMKENSVNMGQAVMRGANAVNPINVGKQVGGYLGAHSEQIGEAAGKVNRAVGNGVNSAATWLGDKNQKQRALAGPIGAAAGFGKSLGEHMFGTEKQIHNQGQQERNQMNQKYQQTHAGQGVQNVEVMNTVNKLRTQFPNIPQQQIYSMVSKMGPQQALAMMKQMGGGAKA